MTFGPRLARGLLFSALKLLFASLGFSTLWWTASSSLRSAKGKGPACVVDSKNIYSSSLPQSPHVSPSPIASHVSPPQSPPPCASFAPCSLLPCLQLAGVEEQGRPTAGEGGAGLMARKRSSRGGAAPPLLGSGVDGSAKEMNRLVT